jgi:hypothetical protein
VPEVNPPPMNEGSRSASDQLSGVVEQRELTIVLREMGLHGFDPDPAQSQAIVPVIPQDQAQVN